MLRYAAVLAAISLATVPDDSTAGARKKLAALRIEIQSLKEKVAKLEAQLERIESPNVITLQPWPSELSENSGNPGSIQSTNEKVTVKTRLKAGQILQVEWGHRWWAARVLELHEDGGVKIHYLGWDSNFDEVVPRSRLQLDPDAWKKVKALH